MYSRSRTNITAWYVRNVRVHSGEKPTVALKERGVEYVEIRALDLFSGNPNGVDEDQLRFIEAFLIFCLLEQSLTLDEQELRGIEYNELTVALRGREGRFVPGRPGQAPEAERMGQRNL